MFKKIIFLKKNLILKTAIFSNKTSFVNLEVNKDKEQIATQNKPKNKKKITINDILIEKKQRKTSIKNPIVGGTPSLQITDLKNNPAKTKSFKLPVIIFTIREPSRW